MKYQVELSIQRSLNEVISFFDSSENLKKWQPNLQSFEHIDGPYGDVGMISRLTYLERGKKVEMIETITVHNFPEEFSAIYEAPGVKNWVTNHFIADEPTKTTWINKNTFKLSGWMKIMGIFMKGTFPKQTLKDMHRFKEFAETT